MLQQCCNAALQTQVENSLSRLELSETILMDKLVYRGSEPYFKQLEKEKLGREVEISVCRKRDPKSL